MVQGLEVVGVVSIFQLRWEMVIRQLEKVEITGRVGMMRQSR